MPRLLPSGSVRGPVLCRRHPEGLGLRQRLWCLLRLKTTQGIQGGREHSARGREKGFGQGSGLGCRGACGHREVSCCQVRVAEGEPPPSFFWGHWSRSATGGQYMFVSGAREGGGAAQCWPGSTARPLLAILPDLGAEEAPSRRGPHCASGGAAHAMPRAAERRDALGGWLVKKESRESSGVVLRDWGSWGVVEWPFLIQGFKRETRTAPC